MQKWIILSAASSASIVIALTAPDTLADWPGGFVCMGLPVMIGISFRSRAMSRAADIDSGATAS